METIVRDVRFALRGMARAPGYTGLGVVLGLAGSYVATGALSALLFAVDPRDGATFAAVAAILAATAMLASYLPARRATRVDPAVTLRAE
jgi:putative ABC transport system permease protein